MHVQPARRYLGASLCTLLLAVCTLAAYPFAESGANDDFAYIWSAKALADTSRIVYCGWSSAMLGWQLALGTIFFKLFGFSFTVARFSVFSVALCTAFLLQRIFVRLGLNERNSIFATLTLVLSPLFVPLSFSFMTDIPALFTIASTLYACLRAVQESDRIRSVAWILFAAFTSTVLGTARQTGWLGVLVLVPSTCWIIRHRRLPFVFLLLFWTVCCAFIFGAIRWFNHQLYVTKEIAPPFAPNHDQMLAAAIAALRILLELAFFFLPISVAFIASLMKYARRSDLVWIAFGTLALASLLLLRPHSYSAEILLAPAVGHPSNYVTPRGILELPDTGARPVVLSLGVRTLLTVVIFGASAAFAVFLRRLPVAVSLPTTSLSWSQTAILLSPFTLAYSVFLGIRAASGIAFDRYLLPLLVVFFLLALRLYQERLSSRLPAISYMVLILYTFFAVAGTHDFFAMERARLATIKELRNAGNPRTSFYGGFGYDGWTQIEAGGYVEREDNNLPPAVLPPDNVHSKFKPCGDTVAKYYPVIQARFIVSYSQQECHAQTIFPAVTYKLWLPPFQGTMYIQQIELNERSKPQQ